MKEVFQRWLMDNTLVPGVFGCGVRLLDFSCVSQSHTELLAAERLDQVWQRLAETLALLHSQRFAPTQLVWKFEESHICVALRHDGIYLGLITSPEASESPAVAALIERFQQFEN
jgi:hypothetical protein